ncbi:hypothetical protein UA08_06209 [Talaromyces atroroseus]|uniref:Amidohydrolase-related domain-containing protein n=1 Tax=Talaromyces atroroseus TaxID=1441469 RepID=A0A225AD90_TALAT|nr:hypothetical protein UA08_06209 [Talaromyces atroroseus]OKL58390.1 hypothetical protein UA08_06209 [Talaromyces atroroseus]
MLPIITLEEHYISSKVLNIAEDPHYANFPAHITTKLNSVGDERVQDLDNGHVSLQVISHGPGAQPPHLCIAANNDLAASISKHPARFKAFALLPMTSPVEAAQELERCVTHLGFVGALIDNHTNGQFYDAKRFWPVFEKAQELDVPIYIHPSYADDSLMEHYKGDFDDAVALALSAYGWGWHSDTALSLLKLYASGLFDHLPRLKIVIGHMGEMLPFQLDRVFAIAARFGVQRSLKEVWTQNVWVTTSGMFALPPLACLLQTMPIERVLYSVDYPFSANEKGYEFLEKVRESGLIGKEEDWEKFVFRNAEALLKIKAVHVPE